MSDLFTEVGREEVREQCFKRYLDALLFYLEKPSKKLHEMVMVSGKDYHDSMRFSLENNSGQLDDFLRKLRRKNKSTWARLLVSAKSYDTYNRLLELSPFANQSLINVRYGYQCASVGMGGIENLVHGKIRGVGFEVFDCDTYAVFVPKERLDNFFQDAKVVWIGGKHKNGKFKKFKE